MGDKGNIAKINRNPITENPDLERTPYTDILYNEMTIFSSQRTEETDIDGNKFCWDSDPKNLNHNLIKAANVCGNINSDGELCENEAVEGSYCRSHRKIRSSKVTDSIYSKYAPKKLKEVYTDIRKKHEGMEEEIELLRALLANVLIRYENDEATEANLLPIIEQLRKVCEYQKAFLPSKRPVDAEQMAILIERVFNILAIEVKDTKVLINITAQMDKILAEGQTIEAEKISEIKLNEQRSNT